MVRLRTFIVGVLCLMMNTQVQAASATGDMFGDQAAKIPPTLSRDMQRPYDVFPTNPPPSNTPNDMLRPTIAPSTVPRDMVRPTIRNVPPDRLYNWPKPTSPP